MKKIIFLLFIFVSCANATTYTPVTINLDILWCWGNSQIMGLILDMIYNLTSNLEGLAKVCVTIGLVFFVIRVTVAGDNANIVMESTRAMLTSSLIFFSFLTVNTTDYCKVYVLEATEASNPGMPSTHYAPVGMKYLLTSLSNIELAVLTTLEDVEKSVTALGSDLYNIGLNQAGFGYPMAAHSTIAGAAIKDTYAYRTFNEYIDNCLVGDVAFGFKDMTTLASSTDLISALQSNSTRFVNVYSSTYPSGKLSTCNDTTILPAVFSQTEINRIKSQLAASSTMSAAGANLAKQDDQIQSYAKVFFNISQTADQTIKNSMAINMTNEAIINSAKASGLDPNALAWGTAMAQQQSKSQFIVSGMMAKEYLPLLQGVMMAIFVSVTWIYALLALTTMNSKYIKSMVQMMLVMPIWAIVLELINMLAILYLSSALPHMYNGEPFTMATSYVFSSKIQNILAWISYLSWSALALAYAIASGSSVAVTSFVGSIAGGITKAAEHSGSGVAKGEGDFGNTKFGNGEARTVNPSTNPRMGPRQEVVGTSTGGEVRSTGMDTLSTPSGSVAAETSMQTLAGGGMVKQMSLNGGASKSTVNAGGRAEVTSIDGITAQTGQEAAATAANKFSQSQKMTEQAAQKFTQTNGFTMEQMSSIATKASKGESIGVSDRTAESLQSANRAALSHAFEDAKSSNEYYSKATVARLEAAASGGFNIGVAKTSAGLTLSGTGSHGESFNMTLTGKEAQAFEASYNKSLAHEIALASTQNSSFATEIANMNSSKSSQAWQDAKEFSTAVASEKAASQELSLAKSFKNSFTSDNINAMHNEYRAANKNSGLSDTQIFANFNSDLRSAVNSGHMAEFLGKYGRTTDGYDAIASNVVSAQNQVAPQVTSTLNAAREGAATIQQVAHSSAPTQDVKSFYENNNTALKQDYQVKQQDLKKEEQIFQDYSGVYNSNVANRVGIGFYDATHNGGVASLNSALPNAIMAFGAHVTDVAKDANKGLDMLYTPPATQEGRSMYMNSIATNGGVVPGSLNTPTGYVSVPTPLNYSSNPVLLSSNYSSMDLASPTNYAATPGTGSNGNMAALENKLDQLEENIGNSGKNSKPSNPKHTGVKER